MSSILNALNADEIMKIQRADAPTAAVHARVRVSVKERPPPSLPSFRCGRGHSWCARYTQVQDVTTVGPHVVILDGIEGEGGEGGWRERRARSF